MHSNHPTNTQTQRTTHKTTPEPSHQIPKPTQQRWLGRPGGHGGEHTPDPIPNSDVKHSSAYDTAPQGAGKSVAARSSKPSQIAVSHKETAKQAGWSSPVARQAHNLKATGSNPVPATLLSSK